LSRGLVGDRVRVCVRGRCGGDSFRRPLILFAAQHVVNAMQQWFFSNLYEYGLIAALIVVAAG
jgi:hypothetical protein